MGPQEDVRGTSLSSSRRAPISSQMRIGDARMGSTKPGFWWRWKAGRRPAPPRVRTGAVVAHAALHLPLALWRARRAGIDVEAHLLGVALIRGVNLSPGTGAADDGCLRIIDP